MGLFQMAYQTYEAHKALVGVYENEKEPLAPLAHITTAAQLEISLTADGSFLSATTVSKKEPKILIPATEESAGRTSGICAHPLCDNLSYLAPVDKNKHAAYLEQLAAWACSSHTHPMLKPILAYVEGGTILDDLKRCDIAYKENNNNVRWRVDGKGCWTDKSLFQAFIDYYSEKLKQKPTGLCMITAETNVPLSTTHLKGIVSFHGNSKLVSSNDSENFTYRGRFSASTQALSISYNASHKAHAALKWLAANQGIAIGDRCFLCWNPNGKLLPQPTNPVTKEQPAPLWAPEDYHREVNRVLFGYKNAFSPSDKAVIAVFDASTNGRLSLTYYNELFVSDFLDRLKVWDTTCCFYHRLFGFISPSLSSIVHAAFGSEQDLIKHMKGEKSDLAPKYLSQQVQRLYTCRVDQAKIPYYFVRALSHKAMQSFTYNDNRLKAPQKKQQASQKQKKQYELIDSSRERLQVIACAVIRKYYLDHFKEEYKMALEPNKNDISYQYGRLLAVLEKAERDTYDGKESRDPNAIRLQSVFCTRPAKTAKIVIEQLKQGYFPHLNSGLRGYYDRLIGEIYENISKFPEEAWNAPLKETYILGYYLQKNALYTKKENNTTESTATEENEHE